MTANKITIFQNIKETATPFHRELNFILDRIKDGASKELVKKIGQKKTNRKGTN